MTNSHYIILVFMILIGIQWHAHFVKDTVNFWHDVFPSWVLIIAYFLIPSK